jgi:GTP-binding protein HflX
VDSSHPNALEQVQIVNQTLREELAITNVPIILALNKVDRVSEAEDADVLGELRAAYPDGVPISATSGAGTGELLARVEQLVSAELLSVVVRLPYAEGQLISQFHELAEVHSEHHASEYVELTGLLHQRFLPRYAAFLISSDAGAVPGDARDAS